MRTLRSLVVLAALILAALPVGAQEPLRATAEMVDASGQSVGTLTLVQESGAVHVYGDLRNLPAGEHGVHIHAVGACTPDFGAAGGHFNPTGAEHGLENPAGAHAGDMANLTVGADGMGSYDYKNERVTLGDGPSSLFDADGSAIVIHEGPDDYQSNPTGNSGGRVACGVIQLSQPETPPPADPGNQLQASAQMVDASGQSVGMLTLVQESGAVRVYGDLRNLPAGEHGVHIHAVGACTPDFGAAGGHFNPTGAEHGLQNPAGAHAGDMVNLTVGADGTGRYDYRNERVTLGDGPSSLFDADGSAIVIHEGPDDHQSNPTGNSGGRVACGVIQLGLQPAPMPTATALPLPETGVVDVPASLPNTSAADSGLPLALLALAVFALAAGAGLTRRALRRR